VDPKTLASLRAKQGETVRTARSLASLRAGRTDWYRIEDNATSADVYIYDEIGYWGVTATDFAAAFRREIDASADVTVHINSPGGNVFDGLAILNVLRAHKGSVTTIVDGLAASAASFIAQAGAKRVMARNSQMMIHKGSSGIQGTADDIGDEHAWWEASVEQMVELFLSRTNRINKREFMRKINRRDWWLSAKEAVEIGFADEIG
jgi:ATP-dependent Clp endopeptidase proteolytic subunit ClpP